MILYQWFKMQRYSYSNVVSFRSIEKNKQLLSGNNAAAWHSTA